MTTTNPQDFPMPTLGAMLDALNQTLQQRTNTKTPAFGKSVEHGAPLASGHWNSLSDVQRHRHIKYVHHIRVAQEGHNVRLSMMYFKPAKIDQTSHHIDLNSAFMHCLFIEHSARSGTIEKVSFGVEQGQQDAHKIALTQTLEGNMAKQFIATLSRGWLRSLLPKEEMTMIKGNTNPGLKTPDMNALAQSTSLMVERASTMHQIMTRRDDNPAIARTVDQAVLHMYEKGDTPLHAATMFDVDTQDVLSRKEFYDLISDTLGEPASKLVVDHLMHSEEDEALGEITSFRRTRDVSTALVG